MPLPSQTNPPQPTTATGSSRGRGRIALWGVTAALSALLIAPAALLAREQAGMAKTQITLPPASATGAVDLASGRPGSVPGSPSSGKDPSVESAVSQALADHGAADEAKVVVERFDEPDALSGFSPLEGDDTDCWLVRDGSLHAPDGIPSAQALVWDAPGAASDAAAFTVKLAPRSGPVEVGFASEDRRSYVAVSIAAMTLTVVDRAERDLTVVAEAAPLNAPRADGVFSTAPISDDGPAWVRVTRGSGGIITTEVFTEDPRDDGGTPIRTLVADLADEDRALADGPVAPLIGYDGGATVVDELELQRG